MCCAGDVLPIDELARLRLLPACAENCDAVLRYQPICGHALGEEVALTVRIQSGKNERPTAENYELETYRNIANDGRLSGADPERASLTFQLVDAPKRGTVELNLDGTFVYTPAKTRSVRTALPSPSRMRPGTSPRPRPCASAF